jgi:hypothetical protein
LPQKKSSTFSSEEAQKNTKNKVSLLLYNNRDKIEKIEKIKKNKIKIDEEI